MNKGYGQYCPLALAAEVLGQRWTILVISRLLLGCTTYSEIQKGVPRISPSLLSQRLDELERTGIIEKQTCDGKRRATYHLTDAGRDLNDIIFRMMVWGQHWARDMSLEDLDPAFLAWSMHLSLDASLLPAGRTVPGVRFFGCSPGLSQILAGG